MDNGNNRDQGNKLLLLFHVPCFSQAPGTIIISETLADFAVIRDMHLLNSVLSMPQFLLCSYITCCLANTTAFIV